MSKLEEFVAMVTNFNKMKQSEMIDCFAYFYIEILKKERFNWKDINDCFLKLSIQPYSNINQYLTKGSTKTSGKKIQKFIKAGNEYSLTRQFSNVVKDLVVVDAPKVEISNTLRSLAPKLNSASERDYLEEAIKTFEVEAYRAAIIMVWLLAIDHLYQYILADKTRTAAFVAALRGMNNKTNIHSKDDFGELKESMFLMACKNSGSISHDVWKILDVKLGIRNSFAHPSTIHLPKSKALEFIEDIVNNVILKY
jgi:hypothetical protein